MLFCCPGAESFPKLGWDLFHPDMTKAGIAVSRITNRVWVYIPFFTACTGQGLQPGFGSTTYRVEGKERTRF
jgi:hypothetical protein